MNIFLGGNNMFSNSNCASVPLVANIDGNGNNGGWADGGWLWIIVVFALLFGWGNGGFGGFGGNNGGGYVATAATQADIQRGFDNSAVISKLDGISNGLCDGFYAMNNSMLTGFNGINTNIMQTGYGIQQAINADTVANMQNTNALQAQLANCCCETREAIQGVNYNMATNTCALQNTMNNNTRDIIDSQQAGTRAILDYLCTKENADLRDKVQKLELSASQDRQSALLTTAMTAQAQQIVNSVNPTAIPAYVVPNPNAYAYGYGCNTGWVSTVKYHLMLVDLYTTIYIKADDSDIDDIYHALLNPPVYPSLGEYGDLCKIEAVDIVELKELDKPISAPLDTQSYIPVNKGNFAGTIYGINNKYEIIKGFRRFQKVSCYLVDKGQEVVSNLFDDDKPIIFID